MKYIATTIAASIFSFNVMAADSSHCNSLDKGPQFNKTVLSEFDKCWLNTHRADKTSGVDGNVFWVKVDDEFISMPIKELFANGSSKAKAKEIIKEKIMEKIVEVESGTIINGLKQDIRNLEQSKSDFLSRLATTNGVTIENFADAIRSAQDIQADLGLIEDALEGFHNGETLESIEDLVAAVNRLSGNGIIGTNGFTSIEGFEGIIDDLEGDIGNLRNQVFNLAVLEYQVGQLQSRVANEGTTTKDWLNRQLGALGVDTSSYNTAEEMTTAITAGQIANNADVTRTDPRRGLGTNYTYSFAGNDATFFINTAGVTFLDTLLTDVDSIIEAAYDQGYSDGYSGWL